MIQYKSKETQRLVKIVDDLGTAYLLEVIKGDKNATVGKRFLCPKDDFKNWYSQYKVE